MFQIELSINRLTFLGGVGGSDCTIYVASEIFSGVMIDHPHPTSGFVSDPNNYRGICVSSCLGKLFCSILNDRIQPYLRNHKPIHKSQIGSDHLFTLKSLIDSHVTYSSRGKVFACFVDLKKAFDIVWHKGLFFKLLDSNIGGNTYNLIKSIYENSTCNIKIDDHQILSFKYEKGVRQGCVESATFQFIYKRTTNSIRRRKS